MCAGHAAGSTLDFNAYVCVICAQPQADAPTALTVQPPAWAPRTADMDDLTREFDLLDTNKDGMISAMEYAGPWAPLGIGLPPSEALLSVCRLAGAGGGPVSTPLVTEGLPKTWGAGAGLN